MSEFFKQLISQFSAIWQKLSLQQKIITSSLFFFTVLGMIALLLWARDTTPVGGGFKTLYSDLELEEASAITNKLKEKNYKYRLENEGRTILVETKNLYEARMMLAREGLPRSRGIGYELFDKTNLAMTDFVQKINAKRALEGELQRTIEGLEEVKCARVHLVIPQPTIFLDQQDEAKASVMVKTVPGGELNESQIRGIAHLVSSSVEGLKPGNVSIIDVSGRLLSNPYESDPIAMASSRNMELQYKVETYLEKNISKVLTMVLGPGKATVSVNADLDFDRVEKTIEKYDPESRVIRSEERSEENVKNAPTGDAQKERSLTNYEIDKTLEHIVQEVGNVKRLTISVAVDGRYEKDAKGVEAYIARTPQELSELENMIKNAVGFDLVRGDQITVANLKFDTDFIRKQQADMAMHERMEWYVRIGKIVAALLLGIIFVIFLMYLARTVAEAMNPPAPQLESFGAPRQVRLEVPEEVKKTSELLERVELITRQQPVNIAAIIRNWLREVPSSGTARGK